MAKAIEVSASSFGLLVEAFVRDGGKMVDRLESLFQFGFGQVTHGNFSYLNRLVQVMESDNVALPRGCTLSKFREYLTTVTVMVPGIDGANEESAQAALQIAPKSKALMWAAPHEFAKSAVFVAKWWTVKKAKDQAEFDMEALAVVLLKLAKNVAKSGDKDVSTLSITVLHEMLDAAVAAVPNETEVIAGIAGHGRTAGPAR